MDSSEAKNADSPGSEVSTRMLANINALAPFNSVPSGKFENHPDDITLGDGENRLMQAKMLDVCKEAMDRGISTQIFANPNGFAGDTALKEAIASYFNRYLSPSIPVKPKHIVPTAGSGNAIEGLMFTLCDAGDSILCPAPAWRGYDVYAHLKSGINVIPAYIDTKSSSWWTESMSMAIIPALEKAYNSAADPKRIKALLVSNPNNPFSRCWPPEVVREMMKFSHKYGLHYISDEVFANTVFDPDGNQFRSALSFLRCPSDSQISDDQTEDLIADAGRVHVVWSMTKDFGTCGIRSGCAMTYNNLIRDGVSYTSFWQISSLAALFTKTVLTSPQLDSWVSSTKLELKNCYQMCNDILVVPELSGRLQILPSNAGFWVNAIVTLRDGESMDTVVKNARENRVVIYPAHDFKRFLGENHGEFKLTFAKGKNVLKRVLERLRESLI